MLYWAEGAKSRNVIQFTNSDPHMLVLFTCFLTDALRIRREDILFTINVYTNNGLSLEEIERYWLQLLNLRAENARKHVTNHMPTSSSGQARNKLPYGVCTLKVNNTCFSTSMERSRSTRASTSRLGCIETRALGCVIIRLRPRSSTG